MPTGMKEEILKNLSQDNDISFGDRYTISHKAKIIFNEIEKRSKSSQ